MIPDGWTQRCAINIHCSHELQANVHSLCKGWQGGEKTHWSLGSVSVPEVRSREDILWKWRKQQKAVWMGKQLGPTAAWDQRSTGIIAPSGALVHLSHSHVISRRIFRISSKISPCNFQWCQLWGSQLKVQAGCWNFSACYGESSEFHQL